MSSFSDSLVTEMESKSGGGQRGRVARGFNEYPLADLHVSSIVLPPANCLSTAHPITAPAAHDSWENEAVCL